MKAVDERRIELVVSSRLIREFIETSSRPRLARLILETDRQELLETLRDIPLIETNEILAVCRDPDDDYLLALAKAADADILVTRDEDLLVLGHHGRTQIIYPAEFLRRLSEDQT